MSVQLAKTRNELVLYEYMSSLIRITRPVIECIRLKQYSETYSWSETNQTYSMISFLDTQQKVLTSFALSYEFIDTDY